MNVSVIIPVHNAQDTLRYAVASALLQPEVKQLLLIDDHSTDNSRKICQEWVAKDDRVQFLDTSEYAGKEGKEGKLGAGIARNIGLRHADQPFIAFLDADDYYLNSRFREDKLLFVNQPQIIGVWNSTEVRTWNGGAIDIYNGHFSHGMTLGYKFSYVKVEATNMFHGNGIHLNGITFKRHYLPQIGYFDESLKQGQDIDFLFRLMKKGEMYTSDQSNPKAIYNIHGNNSIFNTAEALTSRLQLYRKLYFQAVTFPSVSLSWKFLFLYAEYYHLVKYGQHTKNKKLFKLIHFPAMLFSLFAGNKVSTRQKYIPL